MAEILSEEKNPSTKVLLQAGERYILEVAGEKQVWQRISLQLASGSTVIRMPEQDALSLCRAPQDELAKLLQGLERLFKGELSTFTFEPSEPSFELRFTKTRLPGYTVKLWLDSGNAETGFYTGDAIGVRLYASEAALLSFAGAVKDEFGLDGFCF